MIAKIAYGALGVICIILGLAGIIFGVTHLDQTIWAFLGVGALGVAAAALHRLNCPICDAGVERDRERRLAGV